MTATTAAAVPVREPEPGSAAEIAARHGLTRADDRPGAAEYLRQLWRMRHFITAYSRAELRATYSDARLGQVWKLLTPLLNVAVYYLVFGILLNTRKGTGDNYIAFLCTGMFIFTFTRESIGTGTKSIADRLDMIRALHFPRGSLPVAAALNQLQQLLFSLVVMVAIITATGETPGLRWLWLLPAVAVQTVFNIGLALAFARLGAVVRDTRELVPFVLRMWMYTCGVFYSIDHMTKHAPRIVRWLLEANPGSVFIELARYALLDGYQKLPLPLPVTWGLAGGWALIAAVGGYFLCWQAEHRYGRG